MKSVLNQTDGIMRGNNVTKRGSGVALPLATQSGYLHHKGSWVAQNGAGGFIDIVEFNRSSSLEAAPTLEAFSSGSEPAREGVIKTPAYILSGNAEEQRHQGAGSPRIHGFSFSPDAGILRVNCSNTRRAACALLPATIMDTKPQKPKVRKIPDKARCSKMMFRT